MSQGYAIELYFDPALENQVLKAWNIIARRQISIQLIKTSSRPQITLFSSPFVDSVQARDHRQDPALKQDPLPLSFSLIGTLPNEKEVLILTPTPSIPLLQFHFELCEAMKKEEIEIGEKYCPDSWIPFCPVAEQVHKSRMGDAYMVFARAEIAC